MYKCLKKSTTFILIIILALALLCVSTVGVVTATSMKTQKATGKLIILDAGHGGVDPGAIGVNKANEKDINLNIVLCLRDILVANGYDVILTRDKDIAVNDPSCKNISAIKTSDLKNRLKLFKENKNAVVISIHQNKFEQGNVNGAQMFYGKNNEESRLIAEILQKEFKENLQPNNIRVPKRSTSDVYIVHNAPNPIVLVECGFVSNPDECKKLCDEEYQKQIAFTVFLGLTKYLESKNEV